MPKFRVTVKREYILREEGEITVSANTEEEAIEIVKKAIAKDEDDEVIDYSEVDGAVAKDSYEFSAKQRKNA